MALKSEVISNSDEGHPDGLWEESDIKGRIFFIQSRLSNKLPQRSDSYKTTESAIKTYMQKKYK